MAEHVQNVTGFLSKIALDIVSSPLNIALVGVCMVLLYKIVSNRKDSEPSRPKEPELPRMKKRDFTLEQLREYDGRGPGGRILIAVNGKVFDVTRGKKFYGQGGPYSAFGGHDASRGLATFAIDAVNEEYDDLSDLNTMQMESVREWEMQFTDKYDYVGRLLKPGEEPNDYSDDEEGSQSGSGAGSGVAGKAEEEKHASAPATNSDGAGDKSKDD